MREARTKCEGYDRTIPRMLALRCGFEKAPAKLQTRSSSLLRKAAAEEGAAEEGGGGGR